MPQDIYSKAGADAATSAAINALGLGTAAVADATDFETAGAAAALAATLGTAATTDASDYATAAQGAKADSASQPGHTHTADAITDSGTTGRAILAAADAESARTALGLGPSNLVALRTNLCPNPEVTVDLTGWTLFSGTGGAADLTRQTCSWDATKQSAVATWTTEPTDSSGGIYAHGMQLAGGQRVGVSVKVKPSIEARLRIVFVWRTATDVWISDVAAPTVTVAVGTPTVLTAASTAPAGAGRLRVQVYRDLTTGSWTPGSTLEMSQMLVERIDATETAPGAYFSGDDLHAYWAGTRGWSVSIGSVPFTAQLVALTTGIYRGPTAPTFYPAGATYTWFKTDPTTGALLDILNGAA